MIEITLKCDGCGVAFEQARRNNKAAFLLLRAAAGRAGWLNKPHTSIDVCPKCREPTAPAGGAARSPSSAAAPPPLPG